MFWRMAVTIIPLALLLSAAADGPSFPPALSGQWTDNPSACGGEDTGGMRIAHGTVSFYEAVGTARRVRTADDGAIIAEVAYTGEGRTWAETDRFEIAPDSASVAVRALGKSFSLQRCPAR